LLDIQLETIIRKVTDDVASTLSTSVIAL